jgi:AdoMet-dependent rRNA methyltransferase SPB1
VYNALTDIMWQQMLEKFQNLADAPIKKVAEARARKRKRLANKVAAAKKKAEAVSNAPDMSMADKQKVIN